MTTVSSEARTTRTDCCKNPGLTGFRIGPDSGPVCCTAGSTDLRPCICVILYMMHQIGQGTELRATPDLAV